MACDIRQDRSVKGAQLHERALFPTGTINPVQLSHLEGLANCRVARVSREDAIRLGISLGLIPPGLDSPRA